MHEPYYPLKACVKESLFKVFYHDVGLLGAQLNIGYQALVEHQYGFFKGFFLENFAACELMKLTPDGYLFSWQEGESEIEFLWQTKSGKIIPVEIKSQSRSRAKSLVSYQNRYHPLSFLKCSSDHVGDHADNRGIPIYYLALTATKILI